MLYRIIHGDANLEKFALGDATWTNAFRVCAFVFNTKGRDQRLSKDRIAHPIVLDCGLAEATAPDLETMRETIHLILLQNSKMNQGTPKLVSSSLFVA